MPAAFGRPRACMSVYPLVYQQPVVSRASARRSASAAGWPNGPGRGPPISFTSPSDQGSCTGRLLDRPRKKTSRSAMKLSRQCGGQTRPATPVFLEQLQHAPLRHPASLARCTPQFGGKRKPGCKSYTKSRRRQMFCSRVLSEGALCAGLSKQASIPSITETMSQRNVSNPNVRHRSEPCRAWRSRQQAPFAATL